MTVFYGTQMAKFRSTVPPALVDVADMGGKLRVFSETITLATQTTADTIEVARLPKGARVLYGVLVTTVILGTSTVAIGIAGTTGKYRTAATFTTADAPTLFGNTSVLGTALAAEEIVFITIGTASLPGSGTLRVMMVYAENN